MTPQKRDLIYLTGFMASGKSTIAPILANTLGYECVDIDAEIQQTSGKKVSEIFQDHGELYFREVERDILVRASKRHGCVVSLGGGTIAQGDNLQIVKASGILIYLKVEPEHVFQRVKYKTDRPLLRSEEGMTLDDVELREKIMSLLNAREPFYAQADIIIRTDDKRVGITVDELVRQLKHFIV